MVLAHQGGWDEILLVVAPVALFASVLWLANRRAQAQLDQRAAEEPPEVGPAVGAAEEPSPDP